jgi:hypothetical protein
MVQTDLPGGVAHIIKTMAEKIQCSETTMKLCSLIDPRVKNQLVHGVYLPNASPKL